MVEQRAVILGAAGFLGSHLCDRFLAEGWRVTGIDNLITGSLRNLDHLQREPRFDFIRGDLCEPLDVSGPVHGVLDFASPASPVDYLRHPFETLRVGSVGVENALKLARRTGARFLLSSTSEVYGNALEHPQKESYWGNVNPVGPRARLNDGRVVPTFVAQALRGEPITVFGNGRQTRSFCYVDDNVECIWRLLHSSFQDPVNIGNPHELTVLQFAEAVQRLVGSHCP